MIAVRVSSLQALLRFILDATPDKDRQVKALRALLNCTAQDARDLIDARHMLERR
jgi:hypothetical protein